MKGTREEEHYVLLVSNDLDIFYDPSASYK